MTRAGSIRKKTDTIRIAIRTKQYAIRIDDTIQRLTFADIKNLDKLSSNPCYNKCRGEIMS